MNEWSEYLKFLAAMISITNPIGIIPIFVALTEGQPKQEQHRTALRTSLAFAIILIITLFAGEPILRFFGITVSSFKVAGGIIILLMAISMVHGRVSGTKHTKEESEDAADRESLAIVPLCIPLLAGPGAISTVIVYSHQGSSVVHYLLLSGELIVVALLIWLCLNAAPYIAKLFGRIGINVVTRIMGLILAAIGVEFIVDGLIVMFPGLV